MDDNISDGVKCTVSSDSPAACFTFKLPAELQADDVTTVEFWVYKEREQTDSQNQTFVVSEVARRKWYQSMEKSKQIAIHETDNKGMLFMKPVTTLHGLLPSGLWTCMVLW